MQVYPLSCQSAHGGFPAELSVGCLATCVWLFPVKFGSGGTPLMPPHCKGCGGAACPEHKHISGGENTSAILCALTSITESYNNAEFYTSKALFDKAETQK